MKRLRFALTGISIVFVAAVAHADPVLWTLSGVAFSDGETASGSFVFDADTVTYSSIAITSTPGPVVPGSSYSTAHPDAGRRTASNVQFVEPDDRAGSQTLALVFSPPLTNAGGPFVLAGQLEGTCASDGCGNTTRTQSRVITAGSIVGVPVATVDLTSLITGLLSDPPTVGALPISTQTGVDMTGPNQNANKGRLDAFIDRLVAAQDLAPIDLAAACDELDSAAKKVDPLEQNPWFEGLVADELLSQIQTISTDLGCP